MKSTSLFFLSLFLLVSSLSLAQDKSNQKDNTHTLLFRGTPIEQAIKELVDKTNINLIYDPSILKSRVVFSQVKNKRPEEILSEILEGTELDYIQLSSGTYVIIKSAVNKPKYGGLVGKVYDKNTGKPLKDANILIADASTGTSSNQAGRFSVAPLLTGNYQVTVTYVGYKTIRDTVSIPVNSRAKKEFYLESRPVFVEPIVISSIQRRLPYYRSGSAEITELTESLSSYTGSPDAIKSINSVMGVNFSIPYADFNIQGGADGEHRVLLDGTPVYNPVSLGRLTGAFSPYALNKIIVHKAGYRASLGSQLSGIIYIDQDIPGKDENNIMIQADPLSVNGRVNLTTTLGKNTKIKTMLAGRSNIWRWYQKPVLSNTLKDWDRLDPVITGTLINGSPREVTFGRREHRSDIDFYDLHWSNEISFNEFHTSHVSFYRGTNYVQTKLLSNSSKPDATLPESMYTRDTYDWLNNALRLEHNWLISSRWQAQFGLSYSKHKSNHHFGMAGTGDITETPDDEQLIERFDEFIDSQPHAGDGNFVKESSFNATFEYSLNQDHKIGIGLKPKFVDYSFRLSDLFYHSASSRNSTFMLSGFLEDEYSLTYSTKVIGGTRFTYVPDHQKFFAEPRLSVQSDFQQTSLGFISLKLSGGLYRQFINQFDITNAGPSSIVPSIRFWVPIDYTTDVPKSYHLSTETLIEPTENLSFRWEGFYKWNPSILAIDYHALIEDPANPGMKFNEQNTFIEQGKSYSLGTGISAEKLFEQILMELSVSYQYNLAVQKFDKRFDGRFVNTPWNEPHKLSAAINWNVLPSVTTTIRWQSIWGRKWAFNRAYYDYLSLAQNQSQFGSINFNDPSDDKLTPYHQLDLAISYSRQISNSKIQLRLDLIDILDHQNTLEKRLVPQQSSTGELQYTVQKRTLPGFSPSISLKFIY